MTGKYKIAILGAGSAGLAAALYLLKKDKYDVFIFEEQNKIGGLGAGLEINGNIYEYGPHLFHTVDKNIFGDIKELAGDIIFPVERSVLIKFQDAYFTFPLTMKNVISKLPFTVICKAFFSFIFYFIKGNLFRPKVESSETILIRNYGKVLYEIFFKSYIIRVWGIPPSGFSSKFAKERIPLLATINWIFKFISALNMVTRKKVSTDSYVERVEGNLYNTKKGFLGIIKRMKDEIEKRGGHIYTGRKVVSLHCRKDKIVSILTDSNPEPFECDGVISTLPVNNMVKMIEPKLPEEIIKSAKRLKFRALVFVGLLVNKEKILPASFMYFREHAFNRITDMAYFGFEIKPKGHTLIVAEISCATEDRFWTDDEFSKDAVINDLIRENLLSRDSIKEAHVYKSEYAYPIYELGFEERLQKLFEALNSISNLTLAGRQGRFQYVNSHIAMKMGHEAVDELVSKMDSSI